MKKLIICITILLLVGCQQKAIPFKIELDSNPATGYAWNYKIDDKKIIKVTKDEYVEGELKGRAGTSGKQIYEIKALKEGSTTIILNYQKSWEDSAIETRVYKCIVDKELVITCEE